MVSIPELAGKTLHSLAQRQLAGLMILCALLAMIIIVMLVGGMTWLTANIVSLERGWLDAAINWIVGIVLGIGGWFMLPVLVILISGAFQEITIHKVEQADYPDKTRKEEPQFWPDLLHDLRFTFKALVLNILILPFYLVGIGFFLSIALNSYLLGREFFESAAGYHLGKPKAREVGRRNRGMIYGSGLVLTLLTLVPVVNLFAPIVAIVWMVHLFHSLSYTEA
ncbi:MAG: EI24 domain-containing protein [Desulfobulbaceae bacterium]|nr:EI24 domain-containing protein [Desulfobulbaceae bacterium]